MKLFNAFSIQMITGLEEASVSFKEIPAEQVKETLLKGGCDSYIGHADTAVVLSYTLGLEIPCLRRFGTLKRGEQAIVAQVIGGRLPEGATTLPEGMSIRFYLVTVQ